jgi:hypothetical protein
MGIFRKATSISSAGLVSFHSPREKQARAAVIQAKAARTEAKASKKLGKQ